MDTHVLYQYCQHSCKIPVYIYIYTGIFATVLTVLIEYMCIHILTRHYAIVYMTHAIKAAISMISLLTSDYPTGYHRIQAQYINLASRPTSFILCDSLTE